MAATGFKALREFERVSRDSNCNRFFLSEKLTELRETGCSPTPRNIRTYTKA